MHTIDENRPEVAHAEEVNPPPPTKACDGDNQLPKPPPATTGATRTKNSELFPIVTSYHPIQSIDVTEALDQPAVLEAIKHEPATWMGSYDGPLSGARIGISINTAKSIRDNKLFRLPLTRNTESPEVLDLVIKQHPSAETDDVLYRYIVYVIYGRWLDERSVEPVISESVLEWIAGRPFYNGFHGPAVLDKIKQWLPRFEFRDFYHDKNDRDKNRARTVVVNGVSTIVMNAAQASRREFHSKRVHLLDTEHHRRGDILTSQDAETVRLEMRRELDHHLVLAPSRDSAYIWFRMNSRASELSERFTDHVSEGAQCLRDLDITVTNMYGQEDAAAAERLRDYYFDVLHAIIEQPQPFYTFSRRGWTDRIFPYNPSVLSLPSRVRRILCQDFFEIDLRSAHLLIAAALWDAKAALGHLVDPEFNIWDDFMAYLGKGHLEKGSAIYGQIKDALKTATYSAVYGMQEASLAGDFTRAMKETLGADAGDRLRRHPIIRELIDARDEQLELVARVGYMHAPTGIRAVVSPARGRDAKSVLATTAQSYEQLFMKTILEYEQALPESRRGEFQVVAWIHDGCYVNFGDAGDRESLVRTGTNRIVTHLQKLLAECSAEHNVPAFFEAGPVVADRWTQA